MVDGRRQKPSKQQAGGKRQQDSIIAGAYEAFSNAPRITKTLAYLDLDGFRFRLHGFR